MNIDIWSDIRCPFCYIGKRRLEKALQNFEHKDEINITWHSFELDPYMKTQPDKNPLEYLAEIKGQSLEWSVQAHEHLTNVAASVDLDFHFDRCIVANSFDAHRLIQWAKSKGLGDQAKERLLKAYFTEGINIDDPKELVRLGMELGLPAKETEEVVYSEAYATDVRNDEMTAQKIGIRGVPFFVIDRQYGISGAQSSETFLEALRHAWREAEKLNHEASSLPNQEPMSGDTCDIEKGDC